MYIRQAQVEDLPVLLNLFNEHAAFEKAPSPDGNVADLAHALFDVSPVLYVWVLENGHTICGFASATLEFSTWRTRHYFHLDCLYLKPEIRGQGWGRQLMETVQKKAVLLGCDELQWQTPVWNKSAKNFYERLGAQSATKLRFRLQIKL